MYVFNVISLLGGLALFLYGMRLMGNNLKEGSSGTLKVVMEKVTNNPIKAFLLGVAVTAVIQSSTATIVITSGLVAAGIISLNQSLGIIVGANVGTTVTGQIIRLLDIDSGGIANANTVFNIACSIVMLPFIGFIGRLSKHIIKDEAHGKSKYAAKLDALNPVFFSTPALAFRGAYEILTIMLESSIENVKKAMKLLRDYMPLTILRSLLNFWARYLSIQSLLLRREVLRMLSI